MRCGFHVVLLLAAIMAKVCVTIRVVVDKKVIWTGGKLYDDSATVKLVVDAALTKAAARAERGLIFQCVESFQSPGHQRFRWRRRTHHGRTPGHQRRRHTHHSRRPGHQRFRWRRPAHHGRPPGHQRF